MHMNSTIFKAQEVQIAPCYLIFNKKFTFPTSGLYLPYSMSIEYYASKSINYAPEKTQIVEIGDPLVPHYEL